MANTTIKDIYHDTGCNLAPSCLNCPRPRCKYDVPDARGSLKAQAKRIERAEEMARDQLTVKEAAQRWGVTPRTVMRIKAMVKAMDQAEVDFA